MIHIAIADDHKLFRSGLVELLKKMKILILLQNLKMVTKY